MKQTPLSKLAAALALTGAALAAPAWAQTTSGTASLSGFTYQLIDLNPTDAIAPTISFSDTEFHSGVSHSSEQAQTNKSLDLPGTLSITTSNAFASASNFTDGLSATATYSVGPGLQTVGAAAWQDLRFTLAPETGVIFSALSNLHGEVDLEWSTWMTSEMRIWVDAADDSGASQSVGDFNRIFNGANTYQMSAFAHGGAGGATGLLRLSVGVQTDYFDPTPIPAPVPEPESVAMLLAGLAVVGARAVRRRA
ncbi:MAG: PEP-CTERM sorting domain-containing protein [Gammaproteobacteria bacterium]